MFGDFFFGRFSGGESISSFPSLKCVQKLNASKKDDLPHPFGSASMMSRAVYENIPNGQIRESESDSEQPVF